MSSRHVSKGDDALGGDVVLISRYRGAWGYTELDKQAFWEKESKSDMPLLSKFFCRVLHPTSFEQLLDKIGRIFFNRLNHLRMAISWSINILEQFN